MSYGGYSKFSEEEKDFLWGDLSRANKIRKINKIANDAVLNEFGIGSHLNNKGDAFRHCYGAALMVKHLGIYDAMKFLTLHEDRPGNPLNEKAMDLHNNEIGMEIGLGKFSDNITREMCLEAVYNRKLKVLSP